jgi:hypothetical protein
MLIMKYPKLILPVVLLILFGCKKESSKHPVSPPTQPVQAGYKIEIIKGDNQKDSIGHTLTDSVIIRVTNNGVLLKKGYLRFTGSGCDINTPTEVPVYAGLGFYKWQLSGVIGAQQLKVVLLDSARKAIDSLTATANAAMPLHGWQPSPCMVSYNGVKTFCKLKTGQLFALFFNSDFLFTSTDNGINWHALPATVGHYKITNIVVAPDDGLYICTQGDGILYSPDAGATWILRNNGIANYSLADGISVSTLGKILVAVHPDGREYTTTDNGLNWSTTALSPFEQPNGDDYFIDSFSTLRVSSNGGAPSFVSTFPFTTGVGLVFVDDKGYLYITESTNYNDVKLYRSIDNGVTFSPIYTAVYIQGTPLGIAQITEQNGAFYFYAYGSGLIKTIDFKTYTSISPAFTEQSRSYIITKANQLVIGLYYGSIYYYLP